MIGSNNGLLFRWRFNDLRAIALEEIQKLASFRLSDAVLLQHVKGVLTVGFPFGIRNPESAVRVSHIASQVDAGPPGKRTDLFHRELLHSRLRVDASPWTEARKAGILLQTLKKVGDQSGNHVISAQPFVEWRRSLDIPYLHVKSIVGTRSSGQAKDGSPWNDLFAFRWLMLREPDFGSGSQGDNRPKS